MEQVSIIKTNFVLIIIYIVLIGNSSCFLFVYKQQTLDKRLSKNAEKIKQSDISNINFNGIYLSVTNDLQNPKNQFYSFYKFFPNGTVIQNGFYANNPTKNDFEDFSKGEWSVYYVKENNIYIEQFNMFRGYTKSTGYFSEDKHKIIFTEDRSIKEGMIIMRSNTYTLQLNN